MKRKHWIIAVVILVLLVLVWARVSQARSYMQQQITRLAGEGYPGYEIYECSYLSFADFAGFPCITVRARRADSQHGQRDGYHYIAVDFPWIPFMTPEHRI